MRRSRAPSESYARLYRVIRRIPRGKVATYGQVAGLAGMPGSARLAGYALHAASPASGLPWHRVLGAGGRITLVKLDGTAALTQRLRLEREGVTFDATGRVDMERHQWRRGREAARARRRRRVF